MALEVAQHLNHDPQSTPQPNPAGLGNVALASAAGGVRDHTIIITTEIEFLDDNDAVSHTVTWAEERHYRGEPSAKDQNNSREGGAAADPGAKPEHWTDGLEDLLADAKTIYIPGGRKLLLVNYFDDPRYDRLTSAVAKGRAARYFNDQLLTTEEGAEGQRGPNVQIFALLNPETGKPAASLRLVHSGDVESLPSVLKAREEHSVNPYGEKVITQQMAGQRVAEVTDLFNGKTNGAHAAFVLYMAACHYSMEQGITWVAGTVDHETENIQELFGPYVVRVLSEPYDVHDPTAKEGVRLTLLHINPVTVVRDSLRWVDDAANEMCLAKAAGDTQGFVEWQDKYLFRKVMTLELAKGAPDHCIDGDTESKLWSLLYERAA